jgi:polar amino acid transport system substrate-binding protein
VVFVPLVVGLLGALAWTRSLHRLVGQRTASLAREVAERERAAEQLRLQQRQLVQADKMAALGVLVSGVAHEINNPNGFLLLNLPTLKGIFLDALEVLDERSDAGDLTLGGLDYATVRAEVPRMLDEMQGGSRRIKRIVEDLKDFARRDDQPAFDEVDLNAVVQAALRIVEPSIRKATHHFSADYATDLPPVRGSAQRIEQVVVNLVLNACEALPDPDRAVSVSTGEDPERGLVWARVADEGVGITAEHLPRLTDPFFTTKRESGGTGLGLSVSAGIIKEHGGTLTFDSKPGAGTTVTVTLPPARPAQGAA